MDSKKLNMGDMGADVATLQENLKKHGYTVSAEEEQQSLFGPTTKDAVGEFQKAHGIEPSCEVCAVTALQLASQPLTDAIVSAPAISPVAPAPAWDSGAAVPPKAAPFVVRGHVRHVDGSALAQLTIRAFDKDMRSEQSLGAATSDALGMYEIFYSPTQFRRAEKQRADLLVRAYDLEGSVLAASQLLFNAGPSVTVDLTVDGLRYRAPSEYERFLAEITPILQGVPLEELTADDIDFLSGETQINPLHIRFFVIAKQLGCKADLPPAILYGLFRQNMPLDLSALQAQSPETLSRAVETAIKDNLIPAKLGDTPKDLLQRFYDTESEQPIFLLKPELLFASLADISLLNPQASEFITEKLNVSFRQEAIKAIGTVSAAMSRYLESAVARLDYRAFKDKELSAVVKETILAGAKNDSRLADEAANVETRLAESSLPKVSDLLRLDVPLKENPIFDNDIRRVKILEYAAIAQLDSQVAKKLAAKNLPTNAVGDALLDALVKEDLINDRQKAAFRLTIELGKLTGDHIPFVSILKAKGIQSVSDLIGWEKSDWQKQITDNTLPLPPSETADSYAEHILYNIEQTYPSQFLLNRILSARQTARLDLLDSLHELLLNNGQAGDGNSPTLTDRNNAGTRQQDQVQQELQDLTALANTYRDLGVTELLYDKTLDLDKKKSAIAARLQLMDAFTANNPLLDLRLVNFFEPDSKNLNWGAIPLTDRPLVKKQLMTYQRVLNLAGDTVDRLMLLSRGFDSAIAIASQTEAGFIASSGLGRGQARLTYAKAQEAAVSVSHNAEMIRDVASGQFKDIAMSNVPPQLLNDLRGIDGFDVLFGRQSFCECEACRSILSPAAYFVDLMHFIEQHVSKPVFIDPGTIRHPLYLKNRRNDLWQLKLTCENTHTLIPYLAIVNEVLESYTKTLVAGDIFKKLSSKSEKMSFGVPFNLPLEEVRLYLSHLGFTLHDVYRILKQPREKIWREKLKLSQAEFEVITLPDSAGVQFRFGFQPGVLFATAFANFPVQDFIRLAGITRQQLDELLALRFKPDLKKIKIGRMSVPDELKNFPEILENLNASRLDFIHRYIRLWKKTSWSILELDLVLTALQRAGLAGTSLDETAVLNLARLKEIQEKLKLTVEELCPLVDELPVSNEFPRPPAKQANRRLYERLFDLKSLFGEKDPNTHEVNESAIYHHYSLNTNNPADMAIDPKTPILLGGLGISETELLLLFELLKDEMPFDANGDTIDTSILPPLHPKTFNKKTISRLYRHARLAQALGFNIHDFIHALHLNFTPPGDFVVNTLDQIQQLIEFKDWLKTSPFTVSELRFILRGEDSAVVKYKMDRAAVEKIVLIVKGTQEATPLEALKITLSHTFNLDTHQLADLLQWLSVDIKGAGIQTALNAVFSGTPPTPDNPADLNVLFDLVKQLERIALAFSNLKFKSETTAYLTQKPEALGIADLQQLTLENLQALVLYKNVIALRDEAEPTVQAILDNNLTVTVFTSEDTTRLADLWRQDKSLIESLNNSLTLPGVPVDALEYLWEALNLCRTLGVNGYTLQKLADDADFDKVNTARDVSLGAFSAKYEDENIRREKLEPYQDKINVIKRDVLCDYIIARHRDLKFKDLHDLYAFFLLDIEMSGCARTSRVVCAISSLQLYVHRCLVNLEHSDPILNPAIVDVRVDPAMIPAVEWEWRKNYRVWEANRKVFLYPENYIEPDLRDNKTPIFQELEDELLQEKITRESAEAAYKKYVAQFAELARLRIAGSYYHNDTKTYYFFGRTQQDPPQYYYRKWVDTKVWTAWEKIELGINALHISAIVYLGKLFIFWVEAIVKEKNRVLSGSSFFDGYAYELAFNYSYLNENKKWITPNKLGSWFAFPNYVSVDLFFSDLKKANITRLENILAAELTLLSGGSDIIKRADGVKNELNQALNEAFEEASIQLSEWEGSRKKVITEAKVYAKCYPYVKDELLYLEYCVRQPTLPFGVLFKDDNFIAGLDFFHNDLLKTPSWRFANPRKGFIKLSRHSSLNDTIRLILDDVEDWTEGKADLELQGIFGGSNRLTGSIDSSFRPKIEIVHGSQGEAYIFTCSDQEFLIYPVTELVSSDRATVRLSTSLADKLGQKLFEDGLVEFLSLMTQKESETALAINFSDAARLPPPVDDPNHFNFEGAYDPYYKFEGAYGTYYQELFFQIPFLIANHLNANQKFKEAKWWYERIFDPTASESPEPTDRNWRYIKFRGVTFETMKAILTNSEAIEQYKTDPFNPHAIARLRLCAYPKAIVMKYIDNLLDWGDYLFAQDTTESINEATMLYVLAADILGKRPVKLGKCETAREEQLTYDEISPAMDIGLPTDKGTEFLITLENWQQSNIVSSRANRYQATAQSNSVSATDVSNLANVTDGELMPSSTTVGLESTNHSIAEPQYGTRYYANVVKAKAHDREAVKQWATAPVVYTYPAIELIKQSALAFCTPPNYDLLKYWDRVEDRLFKIRHCMNISGVRRQLALFQPPIDPMLLVRAKAAGLSLEDIHGTLADALPPYRFSYLIEKAKQFTQTVQSFGSALLTALEKKDVEELTLLRSVHEREILRMTKEIKRQQLKEAQYQYQAIVETKANVHNRVQYYDGLINGGLTGWERTQQVSMHIGTGLKGVEGLNRIQAGIAYLIPQTGSPFAMKYGGKELGDSVRAMGEWWGTMASVANAISTSAGLEASFERREQEWRHQLLLAQQELKQVEQQRLAAEVRQLIAEKDLEIHEHNMAQADELNAFYKNKFTNLGLYTYLSTTLNRLYREAYNVAYDLANMAQRTYQFERDDNTPIITGDNWQFDRAGLLAGERLLLQLQRLEKSYLEQNKRDSEVTQSFSLALLNPSALVALRRAGSCGFEIPEIMYDLFYPGQYKRLIKSVRITIPCVTGPYTNIGAKLSLIESSVRKVPTIDLSDLISKQEQTSIATSNAQNDGGQFELNFRDERYLPFEGAGAISTWLLELPSTIRMFDYDTISDVIIHISYTAKDEGNFKKTVEAKLADDLITFAADPDHGLYRLFSLRHEFPNAFHKLLNPSGTAQTTAFELTQQHFPYFLADNTLSLSLVTVYLKPKGKNTVVNSGLTMSINFISQNVTWSVDTTVNLKAGEFLLTGSPIYPITQWTIDAGTGGLNKEELDDIFILLKYTV